MSRLSGKADQIPAFRNAAEKRSWLLEQLASVEREALLEEMAAGTNDRITIRLGEAFRIDVGGSTLYEGTDAAKFCSALSATINALPLASAFVVEAGKGGKVLSGGVSADEGTPHEQPDGAAPGRRRQLAPGK